MGIDLLAVLHDARTLWGVAALTLVIAASSRAFRRASSKGYKRGVIVEDTRRRPRLLFSGRSRLPPGFRKLSAVTLGGIPVPFADETRHFKMVGTTGTGKVDGDRGVARRRAGSGRPGHSRRSGRVLPPAIL